MVLHRPGYRHTVVPGGPRLIASHAVRSAPARVRVPSRCLPADAHRPRRVSAWPRWRSTGSTCSGFRRSLPRPRGPAPHPPGPRPRLSPERSRGRPEGLRRPGRSRRDRTPRCRRRPPRPRRRHFRAGTSARTLAPSLICPCQSCAASPRHPTARGGVMTRPSSDGLTNRCPEPPGDREAPARPAIARNPDNEGLVIQMSSPARRLRALIPAAALAAGLLAATATAAPAPTSASPPSSPPGVRRLDRGPQGHGVRGKRRTRPRRRARRPASPTMYRSSVRGFACEKMTASQAHRLAADPRVALRRAGRPGPHQRHPVGRHLGPRPHRPAPAPAGRLLHVQHHRLRRPRLTSLTPAYASATRSSAAAPASVPTPSATARTATTATATAPTSPEPPPEPPTVSPRPHPSSASASSTAAAPAPGPASSPASTGSPPTPSSRPSRTCSLGGGASDSPRRRRQELHRLRRHLRRRRRQRQPGAAGPRTPASTPPPASLGPSPSAPPTRPTPSPPGPTTARAWTCSPRASASPPPGAPATPTPTPSAAPPWPPRTWRRRRALPSPPTPRPPPAQVSSALTTHATSGVVNSAGSGSRTSSCTRSSDKRTSQHVPPERSGARLRTTHSSSTLMRQEAASGAVEGRRLRGRGLRRSPLGAPGARVHRPRPGALRLGQPDPCGR